MLYQSFLYWQFMSNDSRWKTFAFQLAVRRALWAWCAANWCQSFDEGPKTRRVVGVNFDSRVARWKQTIFNRHCRQFQRQRSRRPFAVFQRAVEFAHESVHQPLSTTFLFAYDRSITAARSIRRQLSVIRTHCGQPSEPAACTDRSLTASIELMSWIG